MSTTEEHSGIKRTRTICTGCHDRCGALVYSEGNKIVKITGDPDHPFTKGAFCGSGLSQRFIHEDENRVTYPIKRVGPRGSGEWERISWDEAMDTIVSKTQEIQRDYGPESIVVGQGTSRTTNDWHCRMNSTIGINGWCLAPLHVCLNPIVLPNLVTMGETQSCGADVMYRTGTEPSDSSTIVLWGIASMTIIQQQEAICDAQEKGSTVIVIEPRYNDLAMHADIHVRPRPGTDGALALGFMHVIIKEGLYDAEWIDCWTYGFEELAARAKEFDPKRVSEITWVPEEQIIEVARLMGGNKPTSIWPMLGANCMHSNAIQNGRALACLQGLLGPIDQPGGFLISPKTGPVFIPEITLQDGSIDLRSPEAKMIGSEKYPAFAQLGSAQWPHDVFQAALTEKPWPIKMMVFVANDPLLCYEDPQTIARALQSSNVDLIVVKDYYLTPTAQMADIVLPTTTWAEQDVIDEEMGGGVIFPTQRAVDAPGECLDDWEFFRMWGKALKPELWPWENSREMLVWRIGQMHGIDITWDEYVAKDEISTAYDVRNRTLFKHEKGLLRPDGQVGFNTPTGRFEFVCPTMAEYGYDMLPDYTEPAESPYSTPGLAQEYPLILDTGHRLYSFFHSAWTNVPGQRSLYPHPFAVIHPDDAEARGIFDGDWIEVSSPRGIIKVKAEVSFEAMKGVVAIPRPGWKQECKELGLPGYSWDKAAPNVLVPAEPCDPSYGSAPMRSLLCEVKKKED